MSLIRTMRFIPTFSKLVRGELKLTSFESRVNFNFNSILVGSGNNDSESKVDSDNYSHKMAKFYDNSKEENGNGKIKTFLIAGLGNSPYPNTRHSVGLKSMDNLALRFGLSWEKLQGRLGGLLCKIVMDVTTDNRTEIYLFKPKSLMNVCGGNVAKTAKSLGVKADSIYLVHDELDMAVGKAAIKSGGSARGHRGVISCVSSLRSTGLWSEESLTDGIVLPRLRIGIGRPSAKSEVVNYVLSPVPVEEVKVIELSIERGLDMMLKHIADRTKHKTGNG